MKKWLLIFAFGIVHNLSSQEFLSNGNFETYDALPSSISDYDNCTGWSAMQGGGTPNYLHMDADSPVQLPDNHSFGIVYPHSGKAIMGLVGYSTTTEFREYLIKQLDSPLTIGTEYELSFWITNGIKSFTPGGCNCFGVALTTQYLVQQIFSPVQAMPQFVVTDTLYTHEWREYKFTFVADSAYSYLSLGNFFNDSQTYAATFDTINTMYPLSSNNTYYFIDDISLKIPIVEEFVNIEAIPNIFTPNGDGINDEFIFKLPKEYTDIQLKIINRWGGIIYETADLQSGWNGNCKENECKDGIYYWILTYKDKEFVEHTHNGFVSIMR